jgi:hypothetical protein
VKKLPTDQLQKRESTALAKGVSKAWTRLLQSEGQGQRPKRPDDVPHDKVPNGALAAGISRIFEQNG